MKVWIRSQEKDIITQADNLILADEDHVIYSESEIGQYTLGRYETRERAIEVLNEFQTHIESVSKSYFNAVVDKDYAKYRLNVFEMPAK